MPERAATDARLLFEDARASGVPVSSGTFSVGSRRLAVRCIGQAHWADLERSLLEGPEGPAELTLDVWDAGETGIRPLRTAAEAAALAAHGEVVAFSPGAHELRHLGAELDMLLDGRHATGWVATGRVQAWHRLRPWQRVLVAALAVDGAETVHASMVAQDGAGVMLVGPSGVGKSTTTFACLAAGFQCLGDDTIAVDLDGDAPRGSCVHATVKVSVDQLARFPELDAESEPIADPSRDERALRLGGISSPLVTPAARVAAIAFPRLSERAGSASSPIQASRAATGLLRNALSIDGDRLGPVFAAMTRLAESVPSFSLEVGRDPAGLAGAVESLLLGAA